MYTTKIKTYKTEYIWLDGTKPLAQIRSKTKVLDLGEKAPLWNFDGSSTKQAEGGNSDCVLRPVFICPDPMRNPIYDKLVFCEVLNSDMTSHKTNTRHECRAVQGDFRQNDMWFGIEQEYTLFKDGLPLGFNKHGPAAMRAQGPYYCSVGPTTIYGREFVEEHLNACLTAGLKIGGVNAEVMPGQWEFQIGPLSATLVSDQLWTARYLLHRVAEKYGYNISLDPKPAAGDWNGAGAHTNFSTRKMRSSYDACVNAIFALKKKATLHIQNYGHGIEKRLTGKHETCSHEEFRWGVSDRGASIRIPWQTKQSLKGYVEDRRPNANCDPYVVTRLITEAVCMNGEE
jgi:glutamine synthetase